MPSVEQYEARGYSHAVAEQLAEQDEADLARRAVEMNVNNAPPPLPSNPAFWFECPKPAKAQSRVAEGTGRFADLGRMAEEERDEEAFAEQRVAAFEQEHPPIEPNYSREHKGLRIAVYLDEKAREAKAREAMIEEIREGGRTR